MRTISVSLVLVAAASAQQFASSSMIVKDGEVAAVYGPPRPAPTVTGVPYSADEIGEYTPPDGNSSPTNGVIARFARDTQGRTRIERVYKAAPFWLTEIFDPVGGVAYLLDDQKKVAHRMPLPPAPATNASPSPWATIEKLGSQLIEGTVAEGTRTIFRSPVDAGRSLTVERWESPELKITLLTKSSNGHRSRLINLSRTEPDYTLFRPPSDYTVVDEKDPFPMKVRFR
jgi:hypothetical protein